MEAWASGLLGIHPQQRLNLDLWPIVLAAHPPDLEERDRWTFGSHHELWQLRLAARANLHFTPEHMSRRGPYPLGCAGPPPFPLAWPACLFVTSSALTLPPSVCSSICLSASINLFPVYLTKTRPRPSNIQPSIQAIILPTLVSIPRGSPEQRLIRRPIIHCAFQLHMSLTEADSATARQPHPCAHQLDFLNQPSQLCVTLSLTHSSSWHGLLLLRSPLQRSVSKAARTTTVYDSTLYCIL